MRILALSPIFPWPADSGGKTRIHYVLKGTSELANTTFVTPWDAAQPGPLAEALIPDEISAHIVAVPRKIRRWRHFKGIVSFRPYHCELYFAPEMAKVVAHELRSRRYDLIY